MDRLVYFYQSSHGDVICFLDVPLDDLGTAQLTREVPIEGEIAIWLEYTKKLFQPIIKESVQKQREERGVS